MTTSVKQIIVNNLNTLYKDFDWKREPLNNSSELTTVINGYHIRLYYSRESKENAGYVLVASTSNNLCGSVIRDSDITGNLNVTSLYEKVKNLLADKKENEFWAPLATYLSLTLESNNKH